MSGSMRPRRFAFAFAIALAAALVPGIAHAAGPALAPATIVSEGFEGAMPSRLTLDWALPSPGDPSPAYWGPITQQKHAGARGLWCAGSIPNSSSTTAWTTFGGLYPPYTAGLATFALPELADYYSAKLGFWYRMPTIGSADGDSFNVLWSATSGSSIWDFHVGWAPTSAWTYASFDMGVPTAPGHSRPIDLSRTAGQVRFQFIDSTGDVYESPSTGEGPTIDDVTVSGYKFGPVRGLNASVVDGKVDLTWTVPAGSTALLAADEERPVAYRVWRSPDTSPAVWTELTGARISETAFEDDAPPDGASRYLVQAWDPADGTGYGVADPAAAALATVIPPIPVSTITVTGGSPDSDGVFSELPTVTVTRDAVRGTTYYRWDAGGYISTTATSFVVPALDGTHTLEVYSTNSLAMPETPTVTRTIVVEIPSPGPPPVSAIVVSGTTDAGGTYVTTPTITVSRDQAGGTTYYRWESSSYTATSSASFRVPALAGTHRLEVYSVSGTGVQESPGLSRWITVNVPLPKTKPTVATPTISTSRVRHNVSFYIRGSVKPGHTASTTVKLYLYRYYSRAYHLYKTYTVTVPAGATSYSVKTSLSRISTYRVRAYHSCAVHTGVYSLYKKFDVHT